jgi:OOP family OmpA-OmpF porin
LKERFMFRPLGLAALLLGLSTFAYAAPSAETMALFIKDAAGAADHPLIGRYKGSVILARTQKAFDEITLPSGPGSSSEKKYSATVTAQGTVSRFIYIAPQGRSSLEVAANFVDSLTGKGYEPVFRCAGTACGDNFAALKYHWDRPDTKVVAQNYEHVRKLLIDAAFDQVADLRYGLYKKTTADGDSYAAIFTGVHQNGGFGDYSAALADRAGVLLEIVEPKAMDKRMEVVSADAIGGTIASTGKAVFYGIQFDFDKADIKAESEPQLAEMAKFLKANAQLRAYVVGHTDNKGTLEYNVGLSNKRADSVVKALASRYGIDVKRMTPRGLGPLAPVASNRSEDGQAKNRRVELVEQ